MDAVLIQSPRPDFDTFLAGAHRLLGRSVSSRSDGSQLALTDAEKFRLCLAEFRGRDGPDLNHHLTYSVLLYAYHDDLPDILSICGLPFVVAETTVRGVSAAVVTGSAADWARAIETGRKVPPLAPLFHKLASLFGEQTVLKIV